MVKVMMALLNMPKTTVGHSFPQLLSVGVFRKKNSFEPLSKVVDNLKLRASVGALGNQITNGYHDYMSILSGKVLTNYMMDGKMVNALNITFFA